MQPILVTAALLAGTMMLGTPTAVEASGYDRDHTRRHYGDHDRHTRKHDRRHYRKHHRWNDHRNRHRYRHHSYYWGFNYPGYNVWYRDWPVSLHLDLHNRHHRHDEVVVATAEAEPERVDSVATRSQMFIYPREGQSAEQRDQDRYECHLWSRDQTGFDPSRTNTNFELAADYNRAIAACLEGRGYTVK